PLDPGASQWLAIRGSTLHSVRTASTLRALRKVKSCGYSGLLPLSPLPEAKRHSASAQPDLDSWQHSWSHPHDARYMVESENRNAFACRRRRPASSADITASAEMPSPLRRRWTRRNTSAR